MHSLQNFPKAKNDLSSAGDKPVVGHHIFFQTTSQAPGSASSCLPRLSCWLAVLLQDTWGRHPSSTSTQSAGLVDFLFQLEHCNFCSSDCALLPSHPAHTGWAISRQAWACLPLPANHPLWKPLEVQTPQALGPHLPSATLGLALWAPFSVLALSQIVPASIWNPFPLLLIPLLPLCSAVWCRPPVFVLPVLSGRYWGHRLTN